MKVSAEHFRDEVKQNSDILQLVKQYTELKSSSGSWVGLCPFHEEKTPSFRVYPDNQTYHCYGCQKHGDVFAFIMEQTGCDFVQALDTLAKQANIERDQTEQYSEQEIKRRKQHARNIYVMDVVQNWYIDQLHTTPQGALALKWMGNRGMTADIVKKFKLGYAAFDFEPPSKESKSGPLLFDEIRQSELIKLGVLVDRQQKIYPLLRNRVIFPIHNSKGECIAFSGRRFDNIKEYKYVNTSKTPLFEKSEVIYGMNFARPDKDFGYILTEGYTDVMTMHQFGMQSGLACMGTAMTQTHASVIAKRCSLLTLSFDADQAGLKAVWRSLNVLAQKLSESFRVKVLLLGKDEDPDSYLHKNGEAKFKEKLKNSLEISQLMLLEFGKLSTPEEKVRYLADKKAFIRNIRDKLYREVLISDLAAKTGIDEKMLTPEPEKTGATYAQSGKAQASSQKKIENEYFADDFQQHESVPFDGHEPPQAHDIPLPADYVSSHASSDSLSGLGETGNTNSIPAMSNEEIEKEREFLSLTILVMMDRREQFIEKALTAQAIPEILENGNESTKFLIDMMVNCDLLIPINLQKKYSNSSLSDFVSNVLQMHSSRQGIIDDYKSLTFKEVEEMVAWQIYKFEKSKINTQNSTLYLKGLRSILEVSEPMSNKFRKRLLK